MDWACRSGKPESIPRRDLEARTPDPGDKRFPWRTLGSGMDCEGRNSCGHRNAGCYHHVPLGQIVSPTRSLQGVHSNARPAAAAPTSARASRSSCRVHRYLNRSVGQARNSRITLTRPITVSFMAFQMHKRTIRFSHPGLPSSGITLPLVSELDLGGECAACAQATNSGSGRTSGRLVLCAPVGRARAPFTSSDEHELNETEGPDPQKLQRVPYAQQNDQV